MKPSAAVLTMPSPSQPSVPQPQQLDAETFRRCVRVVRAANAALQTAEVARQSFTIAVETQRWVFERAGLSSDVAWSLDDETLTATPVKPQAQGQPAQG